MNNKFNNPWNGVAGFTDLGSFTDSSGEYYEYIVFLKLSRRLQVQGSEKMEIIFLEV